MQFLMQRQRKVVKSYTIRIKVSNIQYLKNVDFQYVITYKEKRGRANKSSQGTTPANNESVQNL